LGDFNEILCEKTLLNATIIKNGKIIYSGDGNKIPDFLLNKKCDRIFIGDIETTYIIDDNYDKKIYKEEIIWK